MPYYLISTINQTVHNEVIVHTQNVGYLDGIKVIEMNNLSVGYYVVRDNQLWFYPPFIAEQIYVNGKSLSMNG